MAFFQPDLEDHHKGFVCAWFLLCIEWIYHKPTQIQVVETITVEKGKNCFPHTINFRKSVSGWLISEVGVVVGGVDVPENLYVESDSDDEDLNPILVIRRYDGFVDGRPGLNSTHRLTW